MRIVVFLCEGILTGKYSDGKVPATAFLMRRFHTSFTTVSNAYAELGKDGLIARGPYRPPLIVAGAQPYQPDGRFIEAVTGRARAILPTMLGTCSLEAKGTRLSVTPTGSLALGLTGTGELRCFLVHWLRRVPRALVLAPSPIMCAVSYHRGFDLDLVLTFVLVFDLVWLLCIVPVWSGDPLDSRCAAGVCLLCVLGFGVYRLVVPTGGWPRARSQRAINIRGAGLLEAASGRQSPWTEGSVSRPLGA
jgi:hypothetical protein